MRRASAHARLVYEPATPGQPRLHSEGSWRFIAPLGPIEAEDLRWYLEKYAIWPSGVFQDRARKVEENLVRWGQLLYKEAMPSDYTANVLKAWAHIVGNAGRRFSVQADASLEAGASKADEEAAKEAGNTLLGLPWELLHDGRGFLFQGAKPTRVRRRLPNAGEDLGVPVVATPIRILLVAARPEDDACGYIDHRASALPLVEAMEQLGGLVRIHVLSPPTLPALREELKRAHDAHEPYHVVHFDGHGVYDRRVGLGGLCFEDPRDVGKLEKRRHVTVFTTELGPLLRDHRIPLVFLEACQTAQAEKASESVASELLKVGVASVVAMSHSVLVETARRFVGAFYEALARGARVGDAMLTGQRQLKDDTFRGSIFGAGELRIEDWFVPVLFQEKDDPQLFRATPAKQTQEDFKAALAARLGELPAPFAGDRNRCELRQLDREDAVKLVERVLNEGSAGAGATADARREQIEGLVGSVNCHARTLALLAPAIRDRGVEATHSSLVELMVGMDRKFPGNPEKSLFASVELSLCRMSPANREKARVLGVFHGGVSLGTLHFMMQWEIPELASLAGELIETGLATPNRYNHLTVDPALCRYVRGQMSATERESLTERWIEAMQAYVTFLVQQTFETAELAATLTALDSPDLFALLDLVRHTGDAAATIGLASSLYSLLSMSGKSRLLERAAQMRDAALGALGHAWNHTLFNAQTTRIEQQLAAGRLQDALDDARELRQRAWAAGEGAYPDADFDMALAVTLLGQVLEAVGRAEQALLLLDEALERFEAAVKKHAYKRAERMVSVCHLRRGNCFEKLGRFDEAAGAYEKGIRLADKLGDDRSVAAGSGQVGSLRLGQHRYREALSAYDEARERFTRLDEPGAIAGIWHQIGRAYQGARQPDAAEDAYRKSLAIWVRLGDVAGQARTLGQLGIVYEDILNRPEEAMALYRQAADKYVGIRDTVGEGRQRANLAVSLRGLGRLDDARQEIRRAVECDAPFGHAAEPWVSWGVLAEIETDAGDAAASVEAKRRAVEGYLAYRRAGDENHYSEGRICLSVTRSLLDGDSTAPASVLHRLAADRDAAWLLPFIRALEAIVAGSRDRALADAPDLSYDMAAEILFLIETLERGM